MLSDFFERLAVYYNLENDLSNVTVALCNSNDFFKEKFMHFFFPDLKIEDIVSIEREVPDMNGLGSRVDIFVQMKGEEAPYLIEVKLGDRNHHFGQYEAAYGIPKERLGYITNYECRYGAGLGYDVKSWARFYRYMSSLKTADVLISGYLKYLSQVCGLIDVRERLVLSDDSFKDKALDIFTGLCAMKSDKFVVRRRNRFDREDYKMLDFYYGYDPSENARPPFYATIEFNHADAESPFIRIFVTKGSNPAAYRYLQNDCNLREGRTFGKGVRFKRWGDNIGFHLKSRLFNVLVSPEEQIELLRDFFEEVIMRLKPTE